MNKLLLMVSFLFVFSLGTQAQKSVLSTATYSKKYPDSKAVTLLKKEHISISTKKDVLSIVKHVEEKTLVLDETATWLGEESIHYTDFERIENIEAKTLVPVGTKYKSYPVTKVETKDVIVSGIFYGDNKKKTLLYPAVQQGAITCIEYDEVILDPHFLGGYYFKSYLPVESAEFSVSVPKNVSLNYKLFGETEGVVFNKVEKKKETIYTWKASSVDKEKFEPNAPNRNYYTPHVMIFIKEIQYKNKTDHILNEVADLYRWYRSLISGLNEKANNNEMKAIVDDIIEGKTTDIDKVRAIYQWVQQNIKYVAFEDGLGGFRPRESDDICNKKYGDCKDMANIIVEMLGIAGIDGHLTWIGTRDRPYSYNDLPTPLVDNHMIASVEIDGEVIFLDGTGSYIPFGFPTDMIQGKEALIEIDENNFKIVKVPVISPEKNKSEEEIHLTIEDRNVKGKANTKLSGFKKTDYDYRHLGTSNSDINDFYDKVLKMGNNKFKIDTVSETGVFDQNANINIDYEFTLPAYIKKVEEKIYINLNLDKDLRKEKIDIENRKRAYERDYKDMTTRKIVLTIPEGYKVDYLPRNHSFTNQNFSYDISYKVEGNTIIMNKTIVMNHLLLEPSDFENWNKMVQQLTEHYREVVSLKLKN